MKLHVIAGAENGVSRDDGTMFADATLILVLWAA